MGSSNYFYLVPYLTSYKTHGCIRLTPISTGQIKKKKMQILNVMKLI